MSSSASGLANVPQRHIYSRISYLHQAASNLIQGQLHEPELRSLAISTTPNNDTHDARTNEIGKFLEVHGKIKLQEDRALSRHLLSHLRGISLKGQVRLSPAMKHGICKRCGDLLIPGSTSSSCVENKSKGGAKPWADVLVVSCKSCHAARRFPIGAVRQPKKSKRQHSDKKTGI